MKPMEINPKSKKGKPFGGGWRRPIKDDCGTWCNCSNPRLTSNMGIGGGAAYCLKCGYNWYH